MGNLHLRFDEGRAGRAIRVAFSPTLPPRDPDNRCGSIPSHPIRKEARLWLALLSLSRLILQ